MTCYLSKKIMDSRGIIASILLGFTLSLSRCQHKKKQQQQVDAIKSETKNRFERQQALLPFRHLLPEKFNHNNARFQENSEGESA